MSKKCILLSGSPKANGNTVQALTTCARAMEGLGVETEIITLSGKTIAGCKACGGCAKTHQCVIKDGFNEMAAKIKDAEGFVVGAPVYFGTARGDVMNFLQRLGMMSYGSEKWLDGKIGGPVVVGRRGGHTATIQELLMFFFINGMTVPGSTYWNILFGKKPGEVMSDEEGLATIRTFGENVAKLILQQN